MIWNLTYKEAVELKYENETQINSFDKTLLKRNFKTDDINYKVKFILKNKNKTSSQIRSRMFYKQFYKNILYLMWFDIESNINVK